MKTFRQHLKEENSDEIHNLGENLKKHYQFSPKHKEAIKDYTHASAYVNGHLWNTHNKKAGDSKDYTNQIKTLDSLVDKKTPHSLNVFSKTIHDPRELKNSEGIVYHPAYISASLNKTTAKYMKRNEVYKDGVTHHHVLDIDVPKGHKGAYIEEHSSIPGNRNKEFLLPRGLNMRHIETKSEGNDKFQWHTHKMEIV